MKILSINQFNCLKALAELLANQAPHQIRDAMKAHNPKTPYNAHSTALTALFKRGCVKRQGEKPAFYYSITQTGREVLREAKELEKAIATIKQSGAKL